MSMKQVNWRESVMETILSSIKKLEEMMSKNMKQLKDGQSKILELIDGKNIKEIKEDKLNQEDKHEQKLLSQHPQCEVKQFPNFLSEHENGEQMDLDNSYMNSMINFDRDDYQSQMIEYSQIDDSFYQNLHAEQAKKDPDDHHSSNPSNRSKIILRYIQEEQSPILKNIQSEQKMLNVLQPEELLNSLQKQFTKMKLEFTNCQILHRYPEMGKQNFIPKILDRNNFVLVMQLTSGQVIGAFTELNFSSKHVLIPRDNPRCFMFNLTTQHYLYASRTNKTHSRDQNYITFGSWEIKLKAGQTEFQSDLGKRSDCFRRTSFNGSEVLGSTREWLFGQDAELKVFGIQKYGVYIFK